MTVAMDSIKKEPTNTGAPADLLEDWSQIHWPPIEDQVKRLLMWSDQGDGARSRLCNVCSLARSTANY